jgi:hypothetical protein
MEKLIKFFGLAVDKKWCVGFAAHHFLLDYFEYKNRERHVC